MTPTSHSPAKEIPRRLRNRLFILLVFLGGPPFLVWGIYAFWGAGKIVNSFLDTEIIDKTQDYAQKIETAKNLNATFVRYMALQLQHAPRERWQNIVSDLSRAEPSLYNVHVIDSTGSNIVRSDDIPTGKFRYADRDYFRDAMEGNISHEMVSSRAYHKPALCTGQRIEPESIVIAICRFTDTLLNELQESTLGRNGYLFLTDGADRILSHPQLPFHSTELPEVDRLALVRANAGESKFEFEVNGNGYIAYNRQISGHWNLVAIHEKNALSAWATEIMAWPLAAGILTIFMMAGLTFLIVDRGTRPLLKLTIATRDLGPHNLNTKVPVESDDEMGLLAEAFNDMTERLRVAFATLHEKESELQKSKEGLEHLVNEQSQRLLYSTKMSSLGEMAGGIAHEVNNPLAIISMRTQKLREQVESGKIDKMVILETLDKVEKTCGRINKIIRGLRAFSRDGSQDPFVRENLSSVVWEAASLCAEAMRNRGIDLQVQCDAEIEVDCQPVQLGQVILNLLTNARDAVINQKERWVRVEARQIDNTWVEVTVTDSGRGIPPHIAEKIMQPFFTTKQVGQGTGLGLSISKGIVQSHGGELTLNPQSPNTQFVIRLRAGKIRA